MCKHINAGIGIGRLTNNFRAAAVDGCFTIRCALFNVPTSQYPEGRSIK